MVEDRGTVASGPARLADELQVGGVRVRIAGLEPHQARGKVLEPVGFDRFAGPARARRVALLAQQHLQAFDARPCHRVGAGQRAPRGIVVQEDRVAAQEVEPGFGQLQVADPAVEQRRLESEPLGAAEARVVGEVPLAEAQAAVLWRDQAREPALGLLAGGRVGVVSQHRGVECPLPRLGLRLLGGPQQRPPGLLLQFPHLLRRFLSGKAVVLGRLVRMALALVGVAERLIDVPGLRGRRPGADGAGGRVDHRLVRHRVAAEQLQ